MLGIQKLEHLARHLYTTPDRLIEVAENASSFCEELELFNPAQPEKKPRDVLNPTGDLRKFQTDLLRNLLRPKLRPSGYSHGGVQGRHIKTNAEAHIESPFVFSTDVANFYPSIPYQRVYRLFVKGFACSPDVARICTKLCTYDYRLALGLITSPIIADRLMLEFDHRIGKLCENQDLVYTRFVDDITVSGQYPIKSGSVPRMITDVLAGYGFRVNPKKHEEALKGPGRFEDGKCITKLEIKRRRIRVRMQFIEEVSKQLADASRLEQGHQLEGLYYTAGQINGRIHFISWINSGQAVDLERRFHSIQWDVVEREASARGLVAAKKVLRKRSRRIQLECEIV